MIIPYTPFPAVRVNGKVGRFTPRAKAYHQKMEELRSCIYDIEEVQKLIIQGKYIVFYIPMPKSWSKKKREEMMLQPHKQKPDLDNLYKAFTDTVFYKSDTDDKNVSDIFCKKVWADVPAIYIEE